MTFLHKLIIGNRFLRYSNFWWWYRLMSHSGFRFDDYHIWKEFWYSINKGFLDTEYKWEFEKFWGKGAKAETIILSQRDFDDLTERLNEKPDPEALESIRKLLDRRAPWDD
jgi:hypothetical protein